MEAIEEYLVSCCGVIRVPLAYDIRKTIIVQSYGNYPKSATHEDEMIARILYLMQEKNWLQNEQSAESVKEHMTEYKTENKSVNDILDQICKDTDLCPYVKQHKPKRDGRGAFYAIYSRWL